MTAPIGSTPPIVAGPRVGAAAEATKIDETNASAAPTVVRAAKTSTPPTAIRAALGRAYRARFGTEPPERMLDVLTAHVSHETAKGVKMYNYNFGGIKGTSPDGMTARYRTTEYLGGRRRKIVDGFRAYKTLDAGAADYLGFLEDRYPKALGAAKAGDVGGFSRALKARGYYTAPEAGYTRALAAHVADPDGADPSAYDGGGSYIPIPMDARFAYAAEMRREALSIDGAMPLQLPTEVEVARVLNATHAHAATIGAPIDDADEEA